MPRVFSSLLIVLSLIPVLLFGFNGTALAVNASCSPQGGDYLCQSPVGATCPNPGGGNQEVNCATLCPNSTATVQCTVNGHDGRGDCSIDCLGNSAGNTPTNVWVRVLSLEPGNIVTSWKGPQSADPIQTDYINASIYRTLFDNSFEIDDLDDNIPTCNRGGFGSPTFASCMRAWYSVNPATNHSILNIGDGNPSLDFRYRTTFIGNNKTWDQNRNRIGQGMNLQVLGNSTNPINRAKHAVSPNREYWSTHFCGGGLARSSSNGVTVDYFNSSWNTSQVIPPGGSTSVNPYNPNSGMQPAQCQVLFVSDEDDFDEDEDDDDKDNYMCKPDVDGCWSVKPGYTLSNVMFDWYYRLNRLLEWEIAYARESASDLAANGAYWQRLNTIAPGPIIDFDDQWSMSYFGMTELDSNELRLTPPQGYRCKDAWMIKGHGDHVSLGRRYGSPNMNFRMHSDGVTCTLEDFVLASQGNLILFEIERYSTDSTPPYCTTRAVYQYNNASNIDSRQFSISMFANDAGEGIDKISGFFAREGANSENWIVFPDVNHTPLPNVERGVQRVVSLNSAALGYNADPGNTYAAYINFSDASNNNGGQGNDRLCVVNFMMLHRPTATFANSCSSANPIPSNSNEVTINWSNTPNPAVEGHPPSSAQTRVDRVHISRNRNVWPNGSANTSGVVYSKSVSENVTSTTAPNGFIDSNGQPLTLSPGTTYYIRTFDNETNQYSVEGQFTTPSAVCIVPACGDHGFSTTSANINRSATLNFPSAGGNRGQVFIDYTITGYQNTSNGTLSIDYSTVNVNVGGTSKRNICQLLSASGGDGCKFATGNSGNGTATVSVAPGNSTHRIRIRIPQAQVPNFFNNGTSGDYGIRVTFASSGGVSCSQQSLTDVSVGNNVPVCTSVVTNPTRSPAPDLAGGYYSKSVAMSGITVTGPGVQQNVRFDPDGDTFMYVWNSSSASSVVGVNNTNGTGPTGLGNIGPHGRIVYPNTNGISDQVVGFAVDFPSVPGVGGQSVNHCVQVTNNIIASDAGNHYFQLNGTEPNEIRRSSATRAYEVIDGVTYNRINMMYRFNQYENWSQNGQNPLYGRMTIDTTSPTIDGLPNFCHPSVGGICTFNANSSTVSPDLPPNSAAPANPTRTYNMTLRISPDRLEDFMYGGYSHYKMRGMFTATTANGQVLSSTPVTFVPIHNNAPACNAISIRDPNGNLVSASSPTNANTINVTTGTSNNPGLSDDWRIHHRAMYLINSDDNVVRTAVHGGITPTPRLFMNNSINIANLPDGTYNIRIRLYDSNYYTSPRQSPHNTICDQPSHFGSGSPTVVIDRKVPVCTGLSFSASTEDTIVITASATDTNSSGVTRLRLTYRNVDDTSISGVISNTTFAASTSRNQSVNWNWAATNNIPRGKYEIIAEWTDAAGNTSDTNPASSCVAQYDIRKRLKAYINIQSDPDSDGAIQWTQIKRLPGADSDIPISSRTRNFATNSWTAFENNLWISADGANSCNATYPDFDGNDNPNCNQFSRSKSANSNEGIQVRIRLPKGAFNCMFTIDDGVPTNGIITSADEFNDWCHSAVAAPVQGGAGIWNNINSYPTTVKFYLQYRVANVRGTVWDITEDTNTLSKHVGGVYSVSDSKSHTSIPTTTGGGWGGLYGLPALDPDGFQVTEFYGYTEAASYQVNDVPEDYLCLWAFSNAGNATDTMYPNSPGYGSIFNFDRIRYLAQNLRFENDIEGTGNTWGTHFGSSPDCRNIAVPLTPSNRPGAQSVGAYAPAYQNDLEIFVIPKAKVTGEIKFTTAIDSCPANVNTEWDDIPGKTDLPSGVSVDLTLTQTNPISRPAFTLENQTGASPFVMNIQDPLPDSFEDWEYSFSAIANNPGYTTCAVNTIDINSESNIPNYPSAGHTRITNHVLVIVTESNNYMQAYNGGIHSNSTMTLSMPNLQGTTFRPVHLIGDPTTTDVAAAFTIAGAAGNFGGIVTTGGDLPLFVAATGARYGGDFRDWKLASSPARAIQGIGAAGSLSIRDSLRTIALDGENTDWAYRSSGSLPGMLNDSTFAGSIFRGSGAGAMTVTNTSSVTGSRVVFIDGNLNLGATGDPANIVVSGGNLVDNLAVIYVNGDVNIRDSVTVIDAFIVARGHINIEGGNQPLRVRGGLYGNRITFGRDLDNLADLSNFGEPAERILYNPAVIVKQDELPDEIKEAKTYWVTVQ